MNKWHVMSIIVIIALLIAVIIPASAESINGFGLQGGIANGSAIQENNGIYLRAAIGQPTSNSISNQYSLNSGVLFSVSVLSRHQYFFPLQ